MPQFYLRARVQPGEVSVAIRGEGTTATVMPPRHAPNALEVRDLRLANALHLASALADRLGTDVGILDDSETVYFIDDPERTLIVGLD